MIRTNVVKLPSNKIKGKTRTIKEVVVQRKLPTKKLSETETKSIFSEKIKKPPVNKLPQTEKELKKRTKEPDNILVSLQNIINESGMSYIDISCKALIGYTTISRIMDNTTRRPVNSTVDSILSACGYERIIQKRNIT